MSGALLVGLWLVVTAADPPPAAAATASEMTTPKSLIEVGGGPAVATQSLRIGAGLEQPLFVSRTFFVVSTLQADWRHASSSSRFGGSSSDTIDALVGMRLGAPLGSVFELFLGLGVGAADSWTRSEQTFHGWGLNNRLGVAWQMSGGARVHLGERVSLFIVPMEMTGEYWLLGAGSGNPVGVDFTPWAGLGVRL